MQTKTETTPKISLKRNRPGCTPALLLLVLLIPAVWVGYKGSQPMSVADAQGLTLWQFLAERAGKARETPAACQLADVAAVVLGTPYFTAAYIWTGLYPESAWNKTLTPNPEYPRRPENLTWSQVPGEAWRLVEEDLRAVLAVYPVRNEIHSPHCYLPPVTFPARAEASSR